MAGLDINRNNFKKMSKEERDTVLFDNTEAIKELIQLNLQRLDKHELDDRFNQKINWAGILFLAGIIGLKDNILNLMS